MFTPLAWRCRATRCNQRWMPCARRWQVPARRLRPVHVASTLDVVAVRVSGMTYFLPSLLRHCWFGDRKVIQPVKSLVYGVWFVGDDDWTGLELFTSYIAPVVTTTSPPPSSLAPTKSKMETFWYPLIQGRNRLATRYLRITNV